MQKSMILFFLFTASFTIASCQAPNSQESRPTVPTTPQIEPLSDPVDATEATPEAANESESVILEPTESESMSQLEKHPLVFKAKDDLATQTNIPFDQIEIASVKSMTWPDSSMGCPQPGMAYTQVLQDGLLIQLKAGGFIYNYHSGGNREPFLCVQQSGSKDSPVQLDPSMARTPISQDLDK